jgi:hypothetical protein
MKHSGPLALFAALAIAWTWPLAAHLRDAIPGGPGDNYSFVWNLWWMRHVLSTPGLAYFHTDYLFYPFGTTIADHPHTALPAIVAATLLKRTSVVTAQNVLLLSYVFANMACAYALVWAVARHRRGAILGGVIFGLSPYLASHLLGHFDLIAAWVLPLFALMVRRQVTSTSNRWAIGAGIVFVATAYTAYYYVVYLGFFLAVYLIAWLGWSPVRWSRRTQTAALRRTRGALAVLMILLAGVAAWIVTTGGRTVMLGTIVLSIRTPQNVLTGIWLCAIVYALCLWRPALTHAPMPVDRARRVVTTASWIAAVFILGAAPLLWQAAQLVTRGEYVTPAYQWRSAPRGVDLIAPLLGPPLTKWTSRIYAATRMDRIEAVGWMGIVPLILLVSALAHRERTSRTYVRGVPLQADHGPAKAGPHEASDHGPAEAGAREASAAEELHIWRMVAAGFAIWALGPILTIGGFDTGLKLPAILLRYVPFVANARMPGRAIVGLFMALAVLAGVELGSGRRWWRTPLAQWLIIAIVAFEYWDGPIPLTTLDRPAAYQMLAAAPPGAVCEVPFGIGDGLSTGVGSQDRAALYYATVHEHPLAGGYIGRMPADAARRYEAMAIAGTLLRLSDGRADAAPESGVSGSPCAYLVVNRAAASSALRAYVERLPVERIGGDTERDLYRVNSTHETAR